jgi:UDP-N-acetylmuramoyl-L-alanyl-D-glutamate--2,6-diaminopimelate ligase
MGMAAAELSDFVVLTSDNPRSEDPLKICQQIIENLPYSNHIQIEIDRAKAIEQALRFLKPGDFLCIAGKGHESTQHIGNQILPFSDEQTVRKLLSSLSTSLNNEK